MSNTIENDDKINTDSSLRRLQGIGFVSIIAMTAIFGSWAFMARLNSAVIAHATLVSESYTKKIQHRDGGIIQQILVKDGDEVQSGQELVLLDPTETKSELGIVDGLLDEALIKRARLEAQRDGARTMVLPESIEARRDELELARNISGQIKLLESTSDAVKGKRDQLEAQVGQLKEQILGITAQLESKKSQLELINGELSDLKKLQVQGLVPDDKVAGYPARSSTVDGRTRRTRCIAGGR